MCTLIRTGRAHYGALINEVIAIEQERAISIIGNYHCMESETLREMSYWDYTHKTKELANTYGYCDYQELLLELSHDKQIIKQAIAHTISNEVCDLGVSNTNTYLATQKIYCHFDRQFLLAEV